MSPSELSWLQGCLFFILGVAASYGFYWLQNRWTMNNGNSSPQQRNVLENVSSRAHSALQAGSWASPEGQDPGPQVGLRSLSAKNRLPATFLSRSHGKIGPL